MKITEKIELYATITEKANALYDQVKELRAEADTLKQEVAEDLREFGLKSAKSEDGKYTAFFGARKSLSVDDPKQLREWLEENEIDAWLYFNPNKDAIKTLAKEALKKTGEIIPGTSETETESFTIKENK